MVLNIRKLAAIDLHFLGPYVILTEFALGVVGPVMLGLFTLRMASREGCLISIKTDQGQLENVRASVQKHRCAPPKVQTGDQFAGFMPR